MNCLKNPNDIIIIKNLANQAYVDSVKRFKDENLKCPNGDPKQFLDWESPNPETFKEKYFLTDLTQKLSEAFPIVPLQIIRQTAKFYTTCDKYSFELKGEYAGTNDMGYKQVTYSLTVGTDAKVAYCKSAMQFLPQPNTMTTAKADGNKPYTERELQWIYKRDILSSSERKEAAKSIARNPITIRATRKALTQCLIASAAAKEAAKEAAATTEAALETQSKMKNKISSFFYDSYGAQLKILQRELRETSPTQVQQLLSSAQMIFDTQFKNAVKALYPTEQERTSKIITEILEKNKSIMLCKLQVNNGELYHRHQCKLRKVNKLVNSLDPLTFYLL